VKSTTYNIGMKTVCEGLTLAFLSDVKGKSSIPLVFQRHWQEKVALTDQRTRRSSRSASSRCADGRNTV